MSSRVDRPTSCGGVDDDIGGDVRRPYGVCSAASRRGGGVWGWAFTEEEQGGHDQHSANRPIDCSMATTVGVYRLGGSCASGLSATVGDGTAREATPLVEGVQAGLSPTDGDGVSNGFGDVVVQRGAALQRPNLRWLKCDWPDLSGARESIRREYQEYHAMRDP